MEAIPPGLSEHLVLRRNTPLRESPFTYKPSTRHEKQRSEAFSEQSKEESYEGVGGGDSSFNRYKRVNSSEKQRKKNAYHRYGETPLDMKELDTDEVYDISRTSIGSGVGRKLSVDDRKDLFKRDVSVEKSCSFSPFHSEENSRLNERRDEIERSSSQTEWYKREFNKINKKYLSGKRGADTGKYQSNEDDTFESFQRTFKLGDKKEEEEKAEILKEELKDE